MSEREGGGERPGPSVETVYTYVKPERADVMTSGEMKPPADIPLHQAFAEEAIAAAITRRNQTEGTIIDPHLRSRSLFAWPEMTPPADVADTAADRVPLAVMVNPQLAYVARRDLIDPVMTTTAWNNIRDLLREHNVSEEIIDEELGGIGEARTSDDQPSRWLEDDTARQLVQQYLASSVEQYVGSLQSLADFKNRSDQPEGAWEVIVPVEQIQTIERAQS